MISVMRALTVISVITLAFSLIVPASASPIQVYQEGFEGVDTGFSDLTNTLPSGWAATDAGNTWVMKPDANFISQGAPLAIEDSQVLLLNAVPDTVTSGTMWTAIAGDTYTLKLNFYSQVNVNDVNATWKIDILDGGVSKALVTVAHPATAGWFEAETTYFAPAGGLGHDLTASFSVTAPVNGQFWIDNVRLEQTVPEPGTLVLLITGLIGLLAYAWRKRR